MKVFISWSGELSKKIAEVMNKWLPCLLQTIQVFYSPEDIEKGESWHQRIAAELSDCKYGLVCLTSENISAPWVNFEAGAIAKALDAHVATIMVNINPSDIKGPLSSFQTTKLEQQDFLHLIQDINKYLDSPIDEIRLRTTFDGLWSNIRLELREVIQSSLPSTKNSRRVNEKSNTEAIEEILQLVRKQNSLLTSPETLFPREYLEYFLGNSRTDSNDLVKNLLSYLEFVQNRLRKSDDTIANYVFAELQLSDFIRSINDSIPQNDTGRYYAIRKGFMRLQQDLIRHPSENE